MASTQNIFAVLLLTATLLSGCASIAGTFVNPPENGDRVYVGTRARLRTGNGALIPHAAGPIGSADIPRPGT